MQIFQIFQMLLMVVTWTNIEVDVPVYSSIDNYINIPQAELSENGNVFIDDEMYYVYSGVDNNFYSDLDTNYVGKIRYMIKAVFPTYGIESKQEIIFNIVDNVKPTITRIPNFRILVGQKIPDVLIGLDYSDNYYLKSELNVNVLGLDTVNNKTIGKYYFDYQVVDPSNNVQVATSYIEVIDNLPPEIIKLRDLKLEIGETFDVYSFYKFQDNHDKFVNVMVDISNINFNKVGIYSIKIKASDISGNESTTTDYIQIMYTGKPELNLYSNSINIEVGTLNYQEKLISNIKSVSDKVDQLFPSDVTISHLIDINRLGKYQIEYKIKNSNNLETIKLVDVNIVDTTKPTIIQTSDLLIPYGTSNFIHQHYFHIYDNYDDYSDLTISFTYKIDFKEIGSYPIRVEVTDKSKNKSVFEGVIQVVDLEPPIFITNHEEIEINVFSTYNFENYEIKDNYDKNPTIYPKVVSFNEVGVFEINLVATDSSGNTNKKTVIVHVIDDEKPTIVLSTKEIKLSMGSSKLNPLDYLVDAFDNYDDLTVNDVLIVDTVNYNQLGKYELIYYLTDKSDNEAVKIIEVTIDDTTKPLIKTKDIVIQYKSNFDIWEGVEVTDNNDKLTLISYPKTIDTSQIGTYQVTYFAVDERGNMSKISRQIEVVDKDENLKTTLYISANLLITSLITFGVYIYFKHKKRKWLFIWTFVTKSVIITMIFIIWKGEKICQKY